MAVTAASVNLNPSSIRGFSSFLLPNSSSSFSLVNTLSHSNSPCPSLFLSCRPRRTPRVDAIAEKERYTILEESDSDEDEHGFGEVATKGFGEVAEESFGGISGASDELKRRVRPCELYVCNLPRSYGISDLLELFKPYGTVHSVEVSRDPQSGLSRGSGFVTMGSFPEAKYAIAALDGSDVAGREMRVKYSIDMVAGRKNVESLNSATKRNIVFESPYKIYVGNLPRSTKPQDLREYFCQFGTVVSTRVLRDCKRGKNRVYAFLSYCTPDEVKRAAKANGLEFYGRIMSVKEVVNLER
ncbi:hypothetical protein HPP92_005867 [Vanilla planifolia]|uniref:RRM domain-containing protein n=1 Tax=Vanilla planifolia TaxID=51239 RepID=A0A835VF48_VANPL|nr:hypothetical protein HPP92_005867 [Vanilla planifolia]